MAPEPALLMMVDAVLVDPFCPNEFPPSRTPSSKAGSGDEARNRSDRFRESRLPLMTPPAHPPSDSEASMSLLGSAHCRGPGHRVRKLDRSESHHRRPRMLGPTLAP